MERTDGQHLRLVHVLRHSFEPTEKLSELASKLLEKEARVQKLRFFATKIAVLDGMNFHYSFYDTDIRKVTNDFQQNTSGVLPNGEIGFKNAANNYVRIGFQLESQQTFNDLLAGFDALDNLRPDVQVDGRQVNHFIYTEVIQSHILQSKDERNAARQNFNETVTDAQPKSLYAFRPLAISGHDDEIKFSLKDEAIADQGKRKQPWESQDIAS